MKGAGERIKGWLRKPSLVVLGLVALLLIATVVWAMLARVPASPVTPGQTGNDAAYTAPACTGSSELTGAAAAIVQSGNATLYPAAKRLYEEVIARGAAADRACAASGLAQLLEQEDAEATAAASKASRAQKVEKSFSKWTKANIDPLKEPFLAAVAILVLLLAACRLLSGTFVRSGAIAPAGGLRRTWWVIGSALVLAASLAPIAASSISVGDSQWWPAVAAVLSFLLVVAFLPGKAMHWERPVLTLGCAGLVAAVLSAPPFDVNVVLIAGAWAAVAGVVLVASARGLSLAIEVQVRGSSGDENASRARMMVARLQELGSENPRDIRVIGASDVTSLPEDALTTVPTGTLATAVFNVVKLMRPAAPWRITLSQPDDATLVMDVSRNRTAVREGSIVVNVADLPHPRPAEEVKHTAKADEGQEGSDAHNLDDLLTIAAAQTLLVLSDRHPNLKQGLCGARNWRALALHAIAVRRGTSQERKLLLLHAAVDASPRYILPRMALVNETDDSDADGRLRYARSLDRLWDGFKAQLEPYEELNKVRAGYEAAQLRMLYNRAIAWMNVRMDRAFAGQSDDAKDAWVKSAEASIGLNKRIDLLKLDAGPALKDLVEASVRPLGFLLLDLAAHAPSGDVEYGADIQSLTEKLDPEGADLTPQTRNDFYGRACYLAALKSAPDMWQKALIDLQVAASAPKFAEWAPKDPSMAVFTTSNEHGERADDGLIRRFKKIVTAPPPESYLELSIFSPYAATLKAFGLTRLADLAAVSRGTLASTTKVHPSVAQRWVDAAELYDFLRKQGEADDTAPLELLDLLLDMDVASRQELSAKLAGDQESQKAYYAEMVKKAQQKRTVPTWRETIERWSGTQKPDPLQIR